MELFTIEGSNNKLHEIRTNGTSIFISYSSKVAIYTPQENGTLFINRYYKHYSNTTDKHLKLCENEYTPFNIIYVNENQFQELLILIESNPDLFNTIAGRLIKQYQTEIKQLQQIKSNDLKNIPAIKESITTKDTSFKTRNKIINQNTTTTGIKFKVIHTETKTGKLLSSKVKLDKNYNLLSVY